MSRRKQSRPRHVDNDGISLEVEADGLNAKDLSLPKEETKQCDNDTFTPPRKRSNTDLDNEDDDKSTEMDIADEFCPSDEAPSPEGCGRISACEKCGVCFTDLAQFIAHKKLCGSRNRILMPYDPPVNGYIKNGYDFSRNSLDMGKDFSDGEYRDEKDDFESMDEEERSRNDNGDYDDSDEVRSKRKRRHTNEEDEDNDDGRYRSQSRSDENFMLGLQDAVAHSLQTLRDRRGEVDLISGTKSERCNESDRNEDNTDPRHKGLKISDIDPGRGLFGRHNNVILEPLAATSAAVAQCGDNLGPRESVPEEVSMFRTMLFQLQQQQMMQIQMIQQMRRQLIASGVNPSLLPADIDLNMMSSEGLASVGAAMSGLQNATALAAVSRDSGITTSSINYNASRSPSHDERSRDSSPSHSESSQRESDRPLSPASSRSIEKDLERLREVGRKLKEERPASVLSLAERYLSPIKPLSESLYCKDILSTTPLTRNPLEILQEKTAASLSSLPLPLSLRSSSSLDSKPPSSSSSLLNSSALFASSPSISALQKETDALKPSPILPPLSIPMTPEDYKGYIQRGTILERSQYASDDPFFKHKCRFCHKVFGSDSALQIHVRSHTGERPFKCNICGNRFSTKGNLKVHFERHKAKYPHIKMDATPVPEHLDRQPNLMPNFPPTPIPPSVPLPPPMSRLPIPHPHHGPPSSPNSSTHPHHHPHPSPFHPGFGGSFLSPMGPGMSPFGLMPPPRDSSMPFPIPLSLSLPCSLGMPLPLGRDSLARDSLARDSLARDSLARDSLARDSIARDSIARDSLTRDSIARDSIARDSLARRESPTKLSTSSHETSVIRSPRKESPLSTHRDVSPTDTRRPSFHLSHHHFINLHPFHSPLFDSHPRPPSFVSESSKCEESCESKEEQEKEPEEREIRRSRSRNDSADSRSPSPLARKSSTVSVTLPVALPNSPPPPLSRPSSSHSPRQSPASVISWASLSSSQPSHHPALFSHPHLPPGFPGLGLPLPGNPTSFPLPPPLSTVLTMSGPRLGGHPPFLPPPPPPPLPQHISPPPGEGPMFRNSILPTKTIDPSENLEQYMEVQKSETSKLEALVKNIEQKITDPNQCVVCHRVLSCKSALQMHYRIHTGERPFKCKICGRSFTTKGNLKTHMGVHRAKPALRMMHQCPVCHKQFTNVLVLQQHIRAHTGSMQHMSHVPLLPPHMDWAQRPPFGLNRHHPYLPPLHQSLDLPGVPAFSHRPRERSRSASSDHNKDNSSIKQEKDIKQDPMNDNEEEKHSDDDVSKDDNISRPHSPDSDAKPPTTSKPSEPPRDSACHGNLTFTKPEFESAFLPPSFGSTPFDAPLAALEERVKAIDSQLSQTSFEKFRNSMGLDTAFFPSSAGLTNGEKITEFGSESASKPESPASGGDMVSYGFPMLGGFDRNSTTCNICLRTFACKSALDIHYRSHTKLKPFQCDVCDRSFSTRGNLKQHLLTHKIRDIPSSAFDDATEGQSGEDPLDKESGEGEDDDQNELPNEDYPYEEDDSFDDEDMDADMDHDEDHDNVTDDRPHSEDVSSPSKSQDDSQEDNNNVSSFQNHNGDERHESLGEESAEPGNLSTGSIHTKPDLQAHSEDPMASSPTSQNHPPSKPKISTTTNAGVGQRSPTGGASSGSSSSTQSSISPASRRTNGPKHQCMTCMKPFSSASALQIHTRTHTGDKPFKCNVCSKAFTTRGNLKVHMGTHMWNNSPSRRGRRMSIEPPFLLSHMKDAPFMPTGFPPRPPLDFFYQYPLPMMNGPESKMNEISVIQNLGGPIPPLPPIPPHLIQGFLPKELSKPNTDYKSTSESLEPNDHLDKRHLSGELDLSVKVPSNKEASPSRSTPSTPSSSLSLSVHPVTSATSVTTSSTPSPSNNKENSSTAALDLRNMRATPWLWSRFPCHHCGQMFPIQDALEHHLRTHHLGKSESPAHPLSKAEPHPPPASKALLA